MMYCTTMITLRSRRMKREKILSLGIIVKRKKKKINGVVVSIGLNKNHTECVKERVLKDQA